MRLFSGKKKLQPVVIATQKAVADHIPAEQFQVFEATSTLGVIRALERNPSLIIVDIDELVEYEDISKSALRSTLTTVKEDGAIVVTSEEFLMSPDEYIGQALLVDRKRAGVRFMAPRVVMFTNFCGGVGKTTLTLSTAKRFCQATGLPTAAVEAGVGGSSFQARLPGDDRVTLYNHVTQDEPPSMWNGVSIYPSDDWDASVLKGDDRLLKALKVITKGNTLTAFDVFPTSPYWPYVLSLATQVFVVVSPRPDSLVQMDAMRKRLADDLSGMDPQPAVHLILNMVRAVGERIPLAGMIDAWVRYNERKAEGLSGVVADPILELIYPGWGKQRHRKDGVKEKAEVEA